nr:MAG TPA: hypothetical protein [Caudoviricetes sp.]
MRSRLRSRGHKPASRDGRSRSVAAAPPHLEEMASQKRGGPPSKCAHVG